MTAASSVVTAGTDLWIQATTGTWHSTDRCSTVRSTRYRPIAARMTESTITAIESGHPYAKLCVKCFGTDGRAPTGETRAPMSRKVTVDTTISQDDTGTVIAPEHPRKDHEMTRTVTPPVTPDGEQASVKAIEDAQAKHEAEWSLDDLQEAMEHKPVNIGPAPDWDAVKGTPAAVRQRAEASLAHNAAILAHASHGANSKNRTAYRWDIQPVPDADKGAMFAGALAKYATNRPIIPPIEFAAEASPVGRVTARCGNPAQFVKTPAGVVAWKEGMGGEPFWGVRYSVRPWEQRGAGRPAGS